MRRLVGRVIRRVFQAGGIPELQQSLAALQAALQQEQANLARNLAETKSGVSTVQAQMGETHSYVVALRQDRAEQTSALRRLSADLEALRTRAAGTSTPLSAGLGELPYRLDAAAMRCLAGQDGNEASNDGIGLASHYARSANLVSQQWVNLGQLPPDQHIDDDLTLDYAVRNNIFVPGPGNEAEVDPTSRTFPWRHFFRDPECGVFLVAGQSNAGNHGDTTYSPRRDVFSLDFLRMRCTRANDPLGGASGNGGSVWSRLGDLLIDNGIYRRVLFVPVAFGGAFIADLVPGGSKSGRTTLALNRLRKELSMLLLPFSAVLWQQGEAEANHTRMSALAYQTHVRAIVADLRKMGVFAPLFVARATLCEAGPHPHDNHQAIRAGQRAVAVATEGILAGPDVDTIQGEGRHDGCHLSDTGLRRCAELWLEVLSRQRSLLTKP